MSQTRIVSFRHLTSLIVLRLQLSHSRLILRFSLQSAVNHANHQLQPHRAPNLVCQTQNKAYLHGSPHCLPVTSIRIALFAALHQQDHHLLSVDLPEAGEAQQDLSNDGSSDGKQCQKNENRDYFGEGVIFHQFECRPNIPISLLTITPEKTLNNSNIEMSQLPEQMQMISLSNSQALRRWMFLSRQLTSTSMYCVWLFTISRQSSVSNKRYLRCNFFFNFWPQKTRVILVERVLYSNFSRYENLLTKCSYVGKCQFFNLTIFFNLKVSFSVSRAESGSGSSNLMCPMGRMKVSLEVGEENTSFSGSKWQILRLYSYFYQLKWQLRSWLSRSTEQSSTASSLPQNLIRIFILGPLARARQQIAQLGVFLRQILSQKERREFLKACS